MELWEIISTILGSNVAVAATTYFSTRKAENVKVESAKDEVLLRRIDFLDKRLSDIEKLVCLKKDCKERR